MGILVLTWNFPPRRGGMENLIWSLCHRLKKTHPLFVITSFAPSAGGQGDWIFRPRWPGFISFFLYAFCQGFLLLWRDPGIKVILGGSALVIPIVILLAKIFCRNGVVLVHGSDLVYPSFLYQNLCVRWIWHCDRLVANSNFTASLAEIKKARRHAIHVIPPGVDTESFALIKAKDAEREMGLEGRKVLLSVGRLVRRKGIKEFLERSLPRIVAEIPDLCFVIAGENPTDSLIHHEDVLGEIKTIVRDMGLQNHVRLLGWVSDDDLARIYQVSDLMVLPALSLEEDVEGFGIVILEAAAAGVPCVATRVGGIPDAVEDGKSGILAGPGEYEFMSQTIVTLLRDDQTRLALGGYAQKRAREKFDWQKVIKTYDAMFESLV